MKGSLDAGILEIYRYVPSRLLKAPVEEMNMDEFSQFLAKARYMEEVETNLYLNALSKLFEGD